MLHNTQSDEGLVKESPDGHVSIGRLCKVARAGCLTVAICRHYTLPFVAWRELDELTGVEGPTDRMDPVEMVLAATGACLINSISYDAGRLGIDTQGMEITINTFVDPSRYNS
ncbi:hypothetical protein ACFL17_10650 [Pseudomonadota bacterium]